MTDDVLFRIQGHAGIISLNKPATIHSLTLGMVHAITEQLLAWKRSRKVKAIIIDHAEGRGFCAGGDIADLRHSILTDEAVTARKFFHDEYQLDHLIFTYPKPVIAFVDGLVMGGGVGISQPARFRVATENTRFAMPETGIGLFPDVGGSYYLSRLEGRVGQFIVLTGARMDGADCVELGLATHYLESSALAEAKERIAREDSERIDGILGTLAAKPSHAKILDVIEPINLHFASDQLEDVIASLERDESEWSARECAAIQIKSPLSSKIALKQLVLGKGMDDFAGILAMEYRIVSRILTMNDFAEGVRALIVDKDNAPKWDPATPEGVSEALIADIFAPLPKKEEWKPL